MEKIIILWKRKTKTKQKQLLTFKFLDGLQDLLDAINAMQTHLYLDNLLKYIYIYHNAQRKDIKLS